MGSSPLLIVLLAVVEVHEHRQCPGAISPGKTHQDRQDDLLVAVPSGGLAVAGADRLPMPCLAVDLPSGVSIDRIIADEDHGLIGGDECQDEATKLAGQMKGGPLGGGEDPLVGGYMPVGQRGGGAADVDDGASSGGEDGRAEEGDEAMERRSGVNWDKGLEQWSSFSG